METPQLPTPRDLLTSMINETPVVHDATSNSKVSSHPKIPLSTRPTLTTLHVLYPGILLPALDLLDRGLVTHVVLKREEGTTADVVQDQQINEVGGDIPSSPPIIPVEQEPSPKAKRSGPETPSPGFYVVRSSQDTRFKNRRTEFTAVNSPSYIVRTSAWNCSCAAFTYNAFPSKASANDWRNQRVASKSVSNLSSVSVSEFDDIRPQKDTWSFGGSSLDGREDGSGVPCCKHLLACVLAERWKDVFGMYVVESEVEKEELAGLGADG